MESQGSKISCWGKVEGQWSWYPPTSTLLDPDRAKAGSKEILSGQEHSHMQTYGIWEAHFHPAASWGPFGALRYRPLSPRKVTLKPCKTFRSTLNTGYITGLDMCKVCTEAVHSVALWTRVTLQVYMCKVCRSSPFRSTLNTGYITGLDNCKVCTEAVHSVALLTRGTLQVWTCVKYVPMQSIPSHFEPGLHYRFGHV